MSDVKQHIDNSLTNFRKALLKSRTMTNKIHDPHTKALKQQDIMDNELQYQQLEILKSQLFMGGK